MSTLDQETLEPPHLRELQQRKLRRLMAALADNAFYRRKLGAAGCDPHAVRTLGDLASLPLLTKDELLRSQRDQPPYGDLPTYPLDAYPYLHRTSGTSGRPLYWLDTVDDWETWMRCWAQVYRGAGLGQGDVVFCAFSFGPFISHWTASEGARRVGGRCLPGAGMSSLQRLEMMLEHGATAVVSTPTYALHLAEVAAGHGIDLAASTVRTTLHAGEPGASVASVKARIEALWGARCFDHAGATEVGAWAFPCRQPQLAMHLNELEFVFEVVDPETGEVAADDRGELVITTLGRLGMPVVRYRTGDLVDVDREPCGCGRTLARIRGGVLGRADDMMIVRGVNLYPSAVDDLVHGAGGVLEYEVEIRRRGSLDELVIKVEPEAGATWEEVENRLHELFRSRYSLRVGTVRAAAGSLPRYEGKARRYKRIER